MNESQLWYCDICDRTINFSNKLRRIFSKSHKHRKNSSIAVKGNEFIRPEIDKVICILNDTKRDCGSKTFHSFENRSVYVFKITIMENIEEIFATITLENMKFKSQFYGVNKKSKLP